MRATQLHRSFSAAFYSSLILVAMLLWCSPANQLVAQTPILTDAGTTHENTDDLIVNDYLAPDISNCTSLDFRFDFNFSFPWEGDGNMESVDECGSFGDCPGDPDDPFAGECGDCWDFLEVSFLVDGVEVFNELIGDAGTTNADQFGSFTLDGHCTNGATTAAIQARTQNWGDGEAVTYSNITIVCYQAAPDPTANPDPVCANGTLNLDGGVLDPGVVASSSWSGPGDIADPSALTTTATNLTGPTATFTLTTTDVNGCTASGDVTVDVTDLTISEPSPVAICYSLIPFRVDVLNLATIEEELSNFDPTLSVNWYFDMAGTDELDWLDPADLSRIVTNFITTVYASVSDGVCESNIVPVGVELSEFPQPDNQQVEICPDADGLASYNPSDSDGDFNGGDPSLLVSYYNSLADAESGSGAITGIVVTPVDLTLFVRVETSGGCAGFAELQLIVSPPDPANNAFLTACDLGAGEGEFDLTQANADVLGIASGTVVYYTDPDLLNEVPDPTSFISPATTVYAVIIDAEGCPSPPGEVILGLETIDESQLGLVLTPDVGCGPTIVSVGLQTPFDPPGDYTFEIEYGPQSVGPFNNITLVGQTGNAPFSIQIDETYIFQIVAVIGPGPSNCRVEFFPPLEFFATIEDGPTANPAQDAACDNGSGEATFDLNTLDATVNGGSGNTVTYYRDAAAMMPIATPAAFTTPTTTIYAQVSDGSTCAGNTAAITLTVNPLPTFNLLAGPISCNGAMDGTLTVTDQTGTPAFTYSWDPTTIGNIPDPTGLGPGSYAVTLTDANNCSATDQVSLSEPPALSLSCNEQSQASNGGSDGVASISISGGTPTYSYTLTGPASRTLSGLNAGTFTIDNLPPGDYRLDITDANGCADFCEFTIGEAAPGCDLMISAVATDIPCQIVGEGSIDLSISSSQPIITIDWSDNRFDGIEDPTNILIAGTYSVTVTDANDCTATTSVTVAEPPEIALDCGDVTNPTTVGGTDGSAAVVLGGGAPPFDLTWSGPVSGSQTGVGVGTFNITDLPAGTYTVNVRDAASCPTRCTFTLSDPGCNLSLDCSDTFDPVIVDAANGGVRLQFTDGTAPYTYTYSGPVSGDSTNIAIDNPTLTGLSAGDYSLTVTDAAGCMASCTFSLSNPVCAGFSLEGYAVSPMCAGDTSGQIFLFVNTSPRMLDSFATTSPFIDGFRFYGFNEDSTQILVAEGLPAGDYTIEVFDNARCSETVSLMVEEPEPLEIDCSDRVEPSGPAATDGFVRPRLAGGSLPYTLSWDGPVSGNTLLYDPRGFMIEDLPAGLYHLQVVDAMGCVQTCDFELEVVPDCELTASLAATPLSCLENRDGQVTLSLTGGTAPFTYDWSDDNLDGQGDSRILTNLEAGSYRLTITDSEGCQSVASTFIPALPRLEINCYVEEEPSAPGANDGSITVRILNAPPGPYALDYEGDNGESGALSLPLGPLGPTQTISNLPAGTYTLTVTTGSGCTASCTTLLEAFPCVVDSIDVELDVTPLVCPGDNDASISVAIVDANSGQILDPADFTLAWNFPTFNGQTDLNNLGAGVYSLTVTDSNGCEVDPRRNNSAIIVLPELVLVCSDTINPSSLATADGANDLFLAGGTPPYSISWTGPTNGTEEDLFPGEYRLENLRAGAYTITMTDAQGCVTECSFILDVAVDCDLMLMCRANGPGEGQGPGSYTFSFTGGIPVYQLSLTGPLDVTFAQNTLEPYNTPVLPAGNWTFTVIDGEGCAQSCTFTIPDCSQFTSVLDAEGVSCAGIIDGSLRLRLFFGTAPYTLDWSDDNLDGNLTEDSLIIANLPAGTYALTVTDALGCETQVSAEIEPAPELLTDCQILQAPSDAGASDGSINVNITQGANRPYTINYDNGVGTNGSITGALGNNIIDGLPAGTYTITVAGHPFCTTSCSVELIPDVCEFRLNALSIDEDCAGAADGQVNVIVSGGTPPYRILWNTGDTTATVNNLPDGTYTVSVTDANACAAEATTIVAAGNPLPSVTIGPGGIICQDSCYALPLTVSSANFPVRIDYELIVNGTVEMRTQSVSTEVSELVFCPAVEGVPPGDFQLRFVAATDLLTACALVLDEVRDFSYLAPARTLLNPTLCFGDSLLVANELFDAANPNGEVFLSGAAAGGCDSIITVELSFLPENRVPLRQTICPTDTLRVGSEIFTSSRPNGEVVFTDSNGCDSTVVVQLTTLNPARTEITTTLCVGDSLVVAGEVFNESRPSGTVTLAGQAANGCDSLVVVDLPPALPPAVENFEFSICPSDTVRIGGQAFFAGNLMDTLVLDNAAANGCDSILRVNLSLPGTVVNVLPPLRLCAGDSLLVGDSLLRATGNYEILLPGVAVNGCDSLVQVDLQVLVPAVSIIDRTLCVGDSLIVGGRVFNAANPSGSVSLPGGAASGCDSLVQVDLQFLPTLTEQLEATLCAGDSLRVGDEWFDQARPSGTVRLSGAGSTGCDSLVQVDLVFLPGSLNTIDTTLCAGETLTVGGETFTVDRPSGIVVLPAAAASGCDSTVFVTTTYLAPVRASLGADQTVCPADDATVVLSFSEAGRFDFRLSLSDGTEIVETGWEGTADYLLNLTGLTTSTSVSIADITHSSACAVAIMDGLSEVSVSDLMIELRADGGPRVSCAGAADGELVVDVVSGQGPIRYRWDDGTTEARITNLRSGTFAVSVSDAVGCTVVDSFTLLEPLPIVVFARTEAVDCSGNSTGTILLDSIAGGSSPYEYSLDGEFFVQATNFPQLLPNQASGAYTLYVQDASDCATTVDLVVPEAVALVLDLGRDETIILGDSLLLEPDYNFVPATWNWTPGVGLRQTDSLITYASPTTTTLYRLEVTDENGCRASDDIRIFVEEEVPIYLPTAFSPNGDGSNEVFMIFGKGVEEIESFQVFDRWGNQVFADGGFQPNDPAHGWDGRLNGEPMNAGVFVYWVRLRLASGETVQLDGEILLLR